MSISIGNKIVSFGELHSDYRLRCLWESSPYCDYDYGALVGGTLCIFYSLKVYGPITYGFIHRSEVFE